MTHIPPSDNLFSSRRVPSLFRKGQTWRALFCRVDLIGDAASDSHPVASIAEASPTTTSRRASSIRPAGSRDWLSSQRRSGGGWTLVWNREGVDRRHRPGQEHTSAGQPSGLRPSPSSVAHLVLVPNVAGS